MLPGHTDGVQSDEDREDREDRGDRVSVQVT